MIINLSKKYIINDELLKRTQSGNLETEIYLIDLETEYDDIREYNIPESYFNRVLNKPKLILKSTEKSGLKVYTSIINLDIMCSDYNIVNAMVYLNETYNLNVNTIKETISAQMVINAYITSKYEIAFPNRTDLDKRIEEIKVFLNTIDRQTLLSCIKLK